MVRSSRWGWALATVAAALAVALALASCGGLRAMRAARDATRRHPLEHRQLVHGDRTRTFGVFVPPGLPADRPVPLVLALHGGGGTGPSVQALTLGRLDDLAERDGAIVVYPEGVDHHWNDGRKVAGYLAHELDVDDVGFFVAIVERLAAERAIDRRRVFVTGVSNGGLMTARVACERADVFAAFAPVIGGLSANAARTCKPSRPVPILFVNGTHDELVPWNGGEVRFLKKSLGAKLPVPETVELFAKAAGCEGPTSSTMLPDRDPADDTRVRRVARSGCRGGADVVVLAIEGGGHTWPGGPAYAPGFFIGRVSHDIDASDELWEFFRAHPMPAEAGTGREPPAESSSEDRRSRP